MTTVLNTLLLIKSIHHYLILFAFTAEQLNMTEWKEYTGSDEQIAEISNTPCGFILRYPTGVQTEIFKRIGSSYVGEYIDSRRRMLSGDNLKEVLTKHKITNYIICNPHPLADMICQQARTGQPVWWRNKSNNRVYGQCDRLFTPFVNHEALEYSFTPFEESE